MSSENLSDFKLIGGTIKLSERPPSSSHSSASRRFYFSKFSSRPSSAFPRLCSGDNSQDDLVSAENDRRPFSADFVMPNPLSGKSKETLTDGSFESIYVPVDFQLASKSLFNELMEEDIEQWRHFEIQNPLEIKGKTSSEHSIPSLVMSDSDRTINANRDYPFAEDKTQKNNVADGTNDIKDLSNKTEISIPVEVTQERPDQSDQAMNQNQDQIKDEKEDQTPTREDQPEDKYVMAPGLTSKPPLPRKPTSQMSGGSEKINGDPIYDYFAIKYNLEADAEKLDTMPAKMPIGEEIQVEIDQMGDAGFGTNEPGKGRRQEGLENRHTVSVNEEKNCSQPTEADGDKKINGTVDDWSEELNMTNVHLKETETDKYLREVRDQCKTANDPNSDDLPLISEMDIDDLFKSDDVEDVKEKTDVKKEVQTLPPPSANKKDASKNNAPTKRSKSKSPVSKRQQQSTKNQAVKKTWSNKNQKDTNASNKSKFTALKSNKVNSPKHEIPAMGDNIETWIQKDVEKVKRNRVEFSELIDSVDELKSTTEISDKDEPIACTTPPTDMKQGNYDEIETIIEALENQDKTSQQKIQTMKKIVTSELSNSIILNESEENLSFRKDNEIIESSNKVNEAVKEASVKRRRNDSDRSSPLDFSSGSNEGRSSARSTHCKHHKHHKEAVGVPRMSRSQSAESRSQTEVLNGIGNYRDLLSYLDEVDKKCTETSEVAKERAQTASKLVSESSSSFDTIPKVEDSVSHSPEQLSSFVIDSSLRVKDKTSCIGSLQNELTSLREKLLSQTKTAEANLRQKSKEQKEETERIAKRHQKFIDQSMEEKKTMARKCEELVEEMHNMEDKYVANMKAIEHRHQVEIQKMKDMQAASEKLRRERWIEGRTQKIKEMAVKSIEPEVERMEKRHQEELSNLRMVHKREIEELESRAARKLQEHSENSREQSIDDREKASAHERDVMRLRYEKMVESEERNYQDQRRRSLADHANRVAECEEREAQAAAEKERAIRQAQEEVEEKSQAATRRHANEMKSVKETAAIEMENWKNSFRKQQSALSMEKETAIRRECKKERDREIESVIEKSENEANKTRSQIEQTAENRIKRLRDKYEMEIKDSEMSEKDAQAKYCDSRTKSSEYEEVISTLRNTIKQLEHQLTEEKLKRSQLESEREQIRDEIRKEYEDKVRGSEREAEESRSSADRQVEQLYSRVRVSLARKDELLSELTNDHRASKAKCLYLENMMEQQRKEYMINT